MYVLSHQVKSFKYTKPGSAPPSPSQSRSSTPQPSDNDEEEDDTHLYDDEEEEEEQRVLNSQEGWCAPLCILSCTAAVLHLSTDIQDC